MFRLLLLILMAVSLVSCDPRDPITEKRAAYLDHVQSKVSVALTPIQPVEIGQEGRWYEYRVKLSNNSESPVWLSKTNVVKVIDYMYARNPEGYFYAIETNDGIWRDAQIGITGRRTGTKEVGPGESVEFLAPVRIVYKEKPLPGTQIRASIDIFADAKDPNGRKISSPTLPFPPQ